MRKNMAHKIMLQYIMKKCLNKTLFHVKRIKANNIM